jgi:hypothetical protein
MSDTPETDRLWSNSMMLPSARKMAVQSLERERDKLRAENAVFTSGVRRKAFICSGCEGVYADEPVTQCDCNFEKLPFIEGYIFYAKSTES